MPTINQQFEQSCRERFGWDESRFDMHGGQYLNGKTYALFHEWQASRAALVVELPALIIDEYADGSTVEYIEAEDVKQALTAAGVSYK